MGAFRKFVELNESLVSTYINRDRMQVPIHKNPSRKTLNMEASYHTDGTAHGPKESGIFLHNNDMYAFDRGGTLHGEIARHMGIDPDGKHAAEGREHLPIYLSHHGDEAHAHVTDASRRTKWHHNPETADYIRNHPQLKKHFKHISVSYYDEDIHGDWEHPHEED